MGQTDKANETIDIDASDLLTALRSLGVADEVIATAFERVEVANFAAYCMGSCHGDWAPETVEMHDKVLRGDAESFEFYRKQMRRHDRETEIYHIRKRDAELAKATGVRIWPPLNPDPDCPRCGGTGYSRIKDDDLQIDQVGRCSCNTRALERAGTRA